MTEAEFFALVTERDEARARVSETYQAYKVAESKARLEVGTSDFALFLAAFREEQTAYSDAERQLASLNDRVSFALESAKRHTFELALKSRGMVN